MLTAQGFDEFMNLVIDDAVEVRLPTKTEEGKRRPLGEISPAVFVQGLSKLTPDPGQILLKGDNVSLIQAIQ